MEITRQQLENRGIRIAVAIPMERTIQDLAFISLIPIYQKGYGSIQFTYQRTDMARNDIAKGLLESDYTHVLMLDADHLHPSDVVERLARWIMADPDKLVVSGLNFRRSPPYDPCAYLVENGKLAAPLNWEPGIGKADAVGHGCILISKEVFKRIEYPYWAYSYNDEGSQSEDIYFCKQCADAGIDIWVDTTTTSPHLAVRVITELDFRHYIKKNTEEDSQGNKVVVAKPQLVIPKMKTKVSG